MYLGKAWRKRSMTPVPSIGSTSLRRGDGRGVGGAVCRWGIDAEEATAVVRPGAKAKLITGRRFAELLAPGQFGSEGASIISRGHRGHRRRHVLFAGHLDRRRGERNGDEDDGSQPGECLSVHGSPQFPFGNMRALPG